MAHNSFCVVTGAASGIGAAIARRLAELGLGAVVADIDETGAHSTAKELRSDGFRAVPTKTDVRDPDAIQAAISAGQSEFGTTLEAFVNNAGYNRIEDPWKLSPQSWDDLFAVNARGAFFGTQIAGNYLKTQGHGAIVNVASSVARGPYPQAIHYAASKAAVLSLSMSFAQALAPYGVRVNTVAPAIVDTPLWDGIDRQLTDQSGDPPGSARDSRIAEIPLRRAGKPQDVADAVAYLLSDAASFVTGECLHLAGGSFMR